MNAYQTYLRKLEVSVAEAASVVTDRRQLRDRDASLQLRKLVSRADLRASGAFFTDRQLSRFAIAPILSSINSASVVLDPACGAGDLLLECSRRLPLDRSLDNTLEIWGEQLIGRDLHHEFVYATKGRLILEAIGRGAKPSVQTNISARAVFPNVRAASIFACKGTYEAATHVVMNPPYRLIEAPEDCEWGSGKINAAALFLESCVKQALPKTRVVAILPDVLRSGSRYHKWRAAIERHAEVHSVRTRGQFDSRTDVHVFVLELTVKNKGTAGKIRASWVAKKKSLSSVNDRFHVSVGAVVDYRDPHKGAWTPFLVAKGLPTWKILPSPKRMRRFSGTTFEPPFVVVKRTSRPEDRHRAAATVITGNKSVAVENHLLVLKPKTGKLSACRSLVKNLRHSKTNVWLNRRIRCRHLTVSSLRDLPWWL